MPFFTANVELERVLTESAKTPMPLETLIKQITGVVKRLQDNMLQQLEDQSHDGARSSLEYLSRPRNSFVVRLKPVAFAAIRTAYDTFSAEWRVQGVWARLPSAWEMVEGPDRELCDQFAQYAAHTLAHSRLFSSTQAAYLGVQPARANAIQMRVSLSKLIRRASEYASMTGPPAYMLGHASNRTHVSRGFGQ